MAKIKTSEQLFNMTPAQKQTWAFIAKYIHENGVPPTVREIAGQFGIDVSPAHGRLTRLQERGVIVRKPENRYKPRAYRLFVWPVMNGAGEE